MKVTLPATELAGALKWAQGSVSSHVMLAALAGVHLEAADGRLTIRATDLEYAAQVSLPAQVDEPGVVLAPRRVADVVARLPNDGVSLAAGERVEIRCGGVSATLAALAAEDFPDLPDPDPSLSVELDVATVDLIAKNLAQWVKPDSDRTSVMGIVVRASRGRMQVFGTDSYRLGMLELEADGEAEAVIPAGLFTAAARLGSDVTFGVGDGQASILTADHQLTVRLIEGKAADLSRIVPDEGEEATLDRAAAIEAVSRAAGFAWGANIATRVDFGETVTLTTNVNAESLAEPIEGGGPELTINFSPAYLLSALRALSGDSVRMLVRNGHSTVLLTGDDERLKVALMPMRVAS
jgi:DNA polymerase III subunit beta